MILKLNKEIYPKKAVQKSLKDYKKIANFKLDEDLTYYIVSGKVPAQEEIIVKGELANYILSAIK
jgi:hypothetical protein